MKIRAQGNSIRLRLTRSEVSQFLDQESVLETIHFPSNQKLKYELRQTDGPSFKAIFKDQKISIEIPKETAVRWASTEEVSLSKDLPINNIEMLRLLVEKDFQCLHERPGQDESDAFPNPESPLSPDREPI